MTARPLGGTEYARELRAAVKAGVEELVAGGGRPPRLAVVLATADESAAWYVRSIARAAAGVGIAGDIVDPGTTASADRIAATLDALSGDGAVDGIILQTPVGDGIPPTAVTPSIDPAKDVDGANPLSLGRLVAGLPAFAPATAEATLRILEHHGVEVAGRHVVVVGRSLVVGKPVLHLMLAAQATVTVCHSRTPDLAAVTRTADILVVAAGRPALIGPDHVRPGAVVVDVGTNPTTDGGLVGDVDPAVAEVAGALTPVPGGVGPVTTALLLEHTLRAARGE